MPEWSFPQWYQHYSWFLWFFFSLLVTPQLKIHIHTRVCLPQNVGFYKKSGYTIPEENYMCWSFLSKSILRKTDVKGVNATRQYTLPRVKIVFWNPVTFTNTRFRKYCNTTNIVTFRRLLWGGGTSVSLDYKWIL